MKSKKQVNHQSGSGTKPGERKSTRSDNKKRNRNDTDSLNESTLVQKTKDLKASISMEVDDSELARLAETSELPRHDNNELYETSDDDLAPIDAEMAKLGVSSAAGTRHSTPRKDKEFTPDDTIVEPPSFLLDGSKQNSTMATLVPSENYSNVTDNESAESEAKRGKKHKKPKIIYLSDVLQSISAIKRPHQVTSAMIKAFVYPASYPTEVITDKSRKLITDYMSTALACKQKAATAEGLEVISFSEKKLRSGQFVVTCANQKSILWLKIMLSKAKPGEFDVTGILKCTPAAFTKVIPTFNLWHPNHIDFDTVKKEMIQQGLNVAAWIMLNTYKMPTGGTRFVFLGDDELTNLFIDIEKGKKKEKRFDYGFLPSAVSLFWQSHETETMIGEYINHKPKPAKTENLQFTLLFKTKAQRKPTTGSNERPLRLRLLQNRKKPIESWKLQCRARSTGPIDFLKRTSPLKLNYCKSKRELSRPYATKTEFSKDNSRICSNVKLKLPLNLCTSIRTQLARPTYNLINKIIWQPSCKARLARVIKLWKRILILKINYCNLESELPLLFATKTELLKTKFPLYLNTLNKNLLAQKTRYSIKENVKRKLNLAEFIVGKGKTNHKNHVLKAEPYCRCRILMISRKASRKQKHKATSHKKRGWGDSERGS